MKKTKSYMIGKKKFMFRAWDWLTIEEVDLFIESQRAIDKLTSEIEADFKLGIEFLDQEQQFDILEKQNLIGLHRCQQLVCFCTDPKKLSSYIANTKGVTYKLVEMVLVQLHKDFGTLQDMIDSVLPKSKFYIHRIGSFYKQAYFVSGLDQTSVVREDFAVRLAKTINLALNDLKQNGRWLNLASFVAVVARKRSELRERSIGKGETLIDKYEDYVKRMEANMKKRQEDMKQMNFSDAIAVFKFFFQAREQLAKKYKKLYESGSNTKETEVYLNRFGVMVAVEDLRAATNMKTEDILMSSVEDFHESMFQQSLKNKAVAAEIKAQ